MKYFITVFFIFYQCFATESTLLKIDQNLSLALQGSNQHPFLDFTMETINLSSLPFEGITLLQTLNSVTSTEKEALITTIPLTGILVGVLKYSVDRKRPERTYHPMLWNTRITPSFPSGHAAVSSGFATVLSLIHPGYSPYAVVYALLSGYSQIYTGNHFISDVLSGWLIGFTVGNIAYQSTVP